MFQFILLMAKNVGYYRLQFNERRVFRRFPTVHWVILYLEHMWNTQYLPSKSLCYLSQIPIEHLLWLWLKGIFTPSQMPSPKEWVLEKTVMPTHLSTCRQSAKGKARRDSKAWFKTIGSLKYVHNWALSFKYNIFSSQFFYVNCNPRWTHFECNARSYRIDSS